MCLFSLKTSLVLIYQVSYHMSQVKFSILLVARIMASDMILESNTDKQSFYKKQWKSHYNQVICNLFLIARLEILSNAGVLQSLLHTVCKQVSKTDYEFNIKYDVYTNMMRKYNYYGYGGQILTFAGLTFYCVKGHSAKLKLLSGFLYVYWINHFFTVASFVGVSLNLNKAFRHLYQIGPEHETYRSMAAITKLIRERTQESDNELCGKYYAVVQPEFKEEKQKKQSLVQNEFFEHHSEYVPKASFEEPRLQYFDSFLTRYPYFCFVRWLSRVRQWVGLEH